jgi:transcription antitermination protein NusB
MTNDEKQNPKREKNNSIDPIARHNARRYALQALYERQLSGTPMAQIEESFIKHRIDKSLDTAYFKAIIYGVIEHEQAIQAALHPFLTRSAKDIDPVESNVLRIGIYELLQRPDVPYQVIINEALQLTKQFGSIEGYKFVNGILDRVAQAERKKSY